MLTTLAEKVDPAHAAVIVVDVQNDFCHSESPYAGRHPSLEHVQAAARRIDELVSEARRAGVPVIFVQNVTRPGSRSQVQMERAARNPPPAGAGESICREGSWGAEFFCVSPQPDDTVVQKTRYSAFINTDLKGLLDARGIRTLIMTGVTTNTCVESTARDGYMLDYYVVMVEDCCGTVEPHLQQPTLENIRDRFGVVVSASEVTGAWSEGVAPAVTAGSRAAGLAIGL